MTKEAKANILFGLIFALITYATFCFTVFSYRNPTANEVQVYVHIYDAFAFNKLDKFQTTEKDTK